MNRSLVLFLIKAAGLSSEDILKTSSTSSKQLSYRKVIVHEQLAAIALLRLSQEVQT